MKNFKHYERTKEEFVPIGETVKMYVAASPLMITAISGIAMS